MVQRATVEGLAQGREGVVGGELEVVLLDLFLHGVEVKAWLVHVSTRDARDDISSIFQYK